ncbi:MAG: 3'(2'),5'-bisphosphate nucleotidase CysQ family protein [Methanoculleaceae archaeon]
MPPNKPGLLSHLIRISHEAGDIILTHYRSSTTPVHTKDDDSPLTRADLESDAHIAGELCKISSIPIVSEENTPDYAARKDFTEFFLVDPLDGTKEFIDGIGEFTVNIALIRDFRPVAGVIHVPALHTTYFAAKDAGAFIQDSDGTQRLPLHAPPETLTAVGSRKHRSDRDAEFYRLNGIQNVVPAGSSLKFCRVAAGVAHLYSRFQGSMEWDIAAGHIIATEAGCRVVDLQTGQEPRYNTQTLRNNHFIVCGPGIDLSALSIPDEP